VEEWLRACRNARNRKSLVDDVIAYTPVIRSHPTDRRRISRCAFAAPMRSNIPKRAIGRCRSARCSVPPREAARRALHSM
jgi:hypothetical protein